MVSLTVLFHNTTETVRLVRHLLRYISDVSSVFDTYGPKSFHPELSNKISKRRVMESLHDSYHLIFFSFLTTYNRCCDDNRLYFREEISEFLKVSFRSNSPVLKEKLVNNSFNNKRGVLVYVSLIM